MGNKKTAKFASFLPWKLPSRWYCTSTEIVMCVGVLTKQTHTLPFVGCILSRSFKLWYVLRYFVWEIFVVSSTDYLQHWTPWHPADSTGRVSSYNMYASLVLTKLLFTGNFPLYVFPHDKMLRVFHISFHSLSLMKYYTLLFILFANHLNTLRVQSKHI